MSTNKTKNLGLHSWVREDKFRMDEFNENFDKIDTAVGAKAEKTGLEALSGRVDKKAEQTALDAETAARSAALATLTEQVNALAAGQLVYKLDKYTGNGNYGSGNKNKLSFDFSPMILFICINTSGSSNYGGFPWIRGQTKAATSHYTAGYPVNLTWDEKSVTWYGLNVDEQLNKSNTTYYYIAIGVAV